MKKVLVIDDDEALRRLMRLELSDTYEVIDTGEPEHGLALALEHRPSAILLDLRMPKYSGYELCQTLTSFSRTHTIPVLIVSGESGGQTIDLCRQLGAVAYFQKPIDFNELKASLGQLVTDQKGMPRSEVRVRLRVPLKLRAKDSSGNGFEETVTTENVSMNGFLCLCMTKIPIHSILDIYTTAGNSEYVGKAEIVHTDEKPAPPHRYGCRFTEKTGPWVLQ
jgi:DNA-binding response OmpR family regulator